MGIRLRVLVHALVFALALSLASCSGMLVGYGSDYGSMLESMGIRIPAEYVKGRSIFYSITLGGVETTSTEDGYLVLSFSEGMSAGRVAHIVAPGKPSLPYLVYTFVIDGYVDDVKLYAVPRSVKLIELSGKVLPAPKPLAYGADSENKFEYPLDGEVYGSDRYFPGVLAEAKVYRGLLGKSIVSVRVYPVQYSPARNRVAYIDRISLLVSYAEPRLIPFAQNSILIIAKPGLADALKPLIELYRARGYGVTLIDTDYVYRSCDRASPIYEYPGFYNPAHIDDIYYQLLERYNSILALKIMGCLSATLGSYSHVLLVGNALDVPPSFYYQLATDYHYLGPYERWIPTDLFYADLNRDLVPDIFVGRIPFSDPQQVSRFVNKVVSWYQSQAAKSDKLVLVGGYTFVHPLMFGETTLSTMTLLGETSSFYTVLQTITNYNYTRENVLSVLRGNENALWLFLLTHGVGNAFAELLLVEPGITTVERIVTSSDLLAMDSKPGVPVVSSVACNNAAWDTDLVPPPSYAFTPPSIGQALLLSPAGGVSYIGSARKAFEPGIRFTISRGVVTVNSYGAAYLHRKIISVYNYYRTIGVPVTLGQVVAEGIAAYLSEVVHNEMTISEVMKLTLLGDVALGLPVPEVVAERPRIRVVEGENVFLYLDSQAMFYQAHGEVPVYRIGLGMIRIYGEGTARVKVVGHRIIGDAWGLYHHKLVEVGELSMINGVGAYRALFDREKSGKVLLKFCVPGWGELRYMVGVAGVRVTPERVGVGGRIVVEAYGLDILGLVRLVELIVAGVSRVEIPINVLNGYLNWTTAMPYTRPGVYDIVVSPRIEDLVTPVPVHEIRSLFRTSVTVYGEEALDLAIAVPSIAELGKEVRILISTTYKGQPIDPTNLFIEVRSPSDVVISSTIERVAKGVYIAKFNAEELGYYSILVRAYYENSTLYAYGSKGSAVTVIDMSRLYDIGEVIRSGAEDIKALIAVLNASLGEIVNSVRILSDRTVVVETALGTITGRLVEINNNVLAINTTAGLIAIRLDSLEKGIEVAKREIIGVGDVVRSGAREVTQSVDKVNARISELKSDVDRVSSDLEQSILVLKAMIGAVYVGLAALGVTTYLLVIKKRG